MWRKLCAVSCAAALVSLGTAASTQAAEGDGVTPAASGSQEVVASGSQEAIESRSTLLWNDSVNDAIDVIQRGDTSGLVGMSSSEASGTLTVVWKSPVDPAVAALDGRALGAVRIVVVGSKYSATELSRAADSVVSASQTGKLVPVSYAYGADDGNGLVVGVDPSVVSMPTVKSIPESVEALTGISTVTEAGAAPTPTGRQNDSDPWYGGGLMEDPGFNPPSDLDPYNFCSTGFAAVTSTGYGRLLTARHCDSAGNLAWKNGQHLPLTNGGTDVDIINEDDTMLVDPIGGTDGWVHGGPWNATSTNSRYHLKVASAGSPVQNQEVCTSGANSGEHCVLSVTTLAQVSWTCEMGGNCHGWRAYNKFGASLAVLGGDSGGPVYQNRSDGRVNARGIIYGGSVPIACGSPRFLVDNCYQYVWFIDITRVTAAWGVTIETVA